MLKVDQGYSLKQAISAFARPEDRKAETEFIAEWEVRKKEAEATSHRIENEFLEKISRAHIKGEIGEEAHLREERLAAIKAPVVQLIEEFGGQIPTQGADAYASRNPITHGLLEALRCGNAVAFGRAGGLQYSKDEIEASRWTGEWEFQVRGDFAKGGVPHVEIYDVTVFLREHVSQREAPLAVAAPVRKRLPGALDSKLCAFLKELGPSRSEVDAQKMAEEHFDAHITRDRIREQRRRGGVRGKAGRPRKQAAKISLPKRDGDIS